MRIRPLLLALVVALPAPAAEPLVLGDAVARALTANPDLAADAPTREAVEAEVRASRAGFLPRLDLVQSYSGSNHPVYAFGTLLAQGRFTETNFNLTALNNPDPVRDLQTRAAAEQVLWDFGRTAARRGAARAGLDAADRSHEQHVRDLVLGVIEAYYGVSKARAGWDEARTALRSAEAILDTARTRVESGMAVEADRLRARVHRAAALAREIEARGALEVAVAALNRLMGLPVDAPQGETAALVPAALPLPDRETLVAGLRAARADYRRLAAEIERAEQEARARRAEFAPSIGAFAAWEADNPSLVRAGGNHWTAGVSFRWNLWAGGADRARLDAARRRVDALRLQLAALDSAMALEVHEVLVRCRVAEQQVEAARAAVAEGEEGLRIMRSRYDAGLATMSDLLLAETARASASVALQDAVYRHRTSFARLEHAAGILSPGSRSVQP
jgi:outer membrane protein TolC